MAAAVMAAAVMAAAVMAAAVMAAAVMAAAVMAAAVMAARLLATTLSNLYRLLQPCSHFLALLPKCNCFPRGRPRCCSCFGANTNAGGLVCSGCYYFIAYCCLDFAASAK